VDIGKQRRVIIVEPEPRVTPAPAPEIPARPTEAVPAPAEPALVPAGAAGA